MGSCENTVGTQVDKCKCDETGQLMTQHKAVDGLARSAQLTGSVKRNTKRRNTSNIKTTIKTALQSSASSGTKTAERKFLKRAYIAAQRTARDLKRRGPKRAIGKTQSLRSVLSGQTGMLA